MARYFGTDGLRGKANEDLTLEQALKIGQALGTLSALGNRKILIGKDTRLSSDLFEHALAAGAAEHGSNVLLTGVVPTGALSMLTQLEEGDYGIMISASHNPYFDNGIKVFDGKGIKLDESTTAFIEDYMDGHFPLKKAREDEIGTISAYENAADQYVKRLLELIHPDLSGYTIAIDCANGSQSDIAGEVLKSLGASVISIHDESDGLNINLNAGSTHPERLVETVLENKADLGLAFDGDADRLIIIDRNGEQLSGDHYLYILSKAMINNDQKPERIVTTQMANLGLIKKLEQLGIEPVLTAVGDKYVFEEMKNNGDPLGGEQSGHMIFLEIANTGDGLLSALKLFEALEILQEPLEKTASELRIFPQLLINVRRNNPAGIIENAAVKELARKIEKELQGKGRLLLRASGTEPLVRIMVEAPSEEECYYYASILRDFVEKNF